MWIPGPHSQITIPGEKLWESEFLTSSLSDSNALWIRELLLMALLLILWTNTKVFYCLPWLSGSGGKEQPFPESFWQSELGTIAGNQRRPPSSVTWDALSHGVLQFQVEDCFAVLRLYSFPLYSFSHPTVRKRLNVLFVLIFFISVFSFPFYSGPLCNFTVHLFNWEISILNFYFFAYDDCFLCFSTLFSLPCFLWYFWDCFF